MSAAIAPIVTPRLRLELLEPRHGPAIERYARLWEVARYTAEVPRPYPPGGGIAFAQAVAFERRHGGGLVWAVVEPATGAAVGTIGLDLGDDRRTAELGYIYDPAVWGRGYATEAARALVDHAFGRLGLDRIVSHAAVENRASCRVLAKAGLRRIGNGRFHAPARGRWFVGEFYRLARSEWQG